jgi:hypothetical protein
VNHYRLLIEKLIHSVIVGADVVLASFEAELDSHSPMVFRVIHCTYLLGKPKTLILRVAALRPDPFSEFNHQRIHELLELVCSGPTTEG